MRFGSRGRGRPILPTIYNDTSYSDDEDSLKNSDKCCGIPIHCYAVGVATLEIVLSFCSILYIIAGLYSFPEYNSGILFHDEMFIEAKQKYCGTMSQVPVALLYCDLFVFMMELFLAFALFHGVVEKKLGKIHFWLSSMVIYTVTLTGIFLGFIIGGISSKNLAIMGGLHAFFRFSEIGIIYGYYEKLCKERRQERRLMENNNSGTTEVCQHSAVVPNTHAIDYDLGRASVDLQFPFP